MKKISFYCLYIYIRIGKTTENNRKRKKKLISLYVFIDLSFIFFPVKIAGDYLKKFEGESVNYRACAIIYDKALSKLI